MKITFEGKTIGDILDQMQDMLARTADNKASTVVEIKQPLPSMQTAGLGAKPVDKPVDTFVSTPVEKPGKRERTEKQKANDEKLRVLAQERKAAGTMFKKTKAPAPVKQVAKPPPQPEPKIEPDPQPEPFADPAEAVRIRQKTITDLQEAYANGHQQEVFELLSRFGNGAKSFRELPPEAFMPIREAIDKGALT